MKARAFLLLEFLLGLGAVGVLFLGLLWVLELRMPRPWEGQVWPVVEAVFSQDHPHYAQYVQRFDADFKKNPGAKQVLYLPEEGFSFTQEKPVQGFYYTLYITKHQKLPSDDKVLRLQLEIAGCAKGLPLCLCL